MENPEVSKLARTAGLGVRKTGFVYSAELGRIECLRCGGRAFTRDQNMASVWERAHFKCCRRKNEPVLVCA